ncbi:MAG: DUF2294 family protein [Actinobacteria bacterium]|nr:DUF2294 family protein [Actinomycetota bacterium]
MPAVEAEVNSLPDISNEQLAAISSEMVRLKAQHYGKGPVGAKTYVNDSFIFSVLKEGMTAGERILIDGGDGGIVRQFRLCLKEHMTRAFTDSVERIVGRRVITYESQVLFDPDFCVEIFLLGEEVVANQEIAEAS